LHDVVTTLQRRVPHIPTVIAPASVQGGGAPDELAQALSKLYLLAQTYKGLAPDLTRKIDAPVIDVILLVRGGGAMEDLWAFNDERLARVIAQSPVPIITGVGHETDFTIADFVADVRAPTPTAAAEMVSLSQDSYFNLLGHMAERLRRATLHRLDTQSQRLDGVASRLGRPSLRMAQRRSALALSAQKLKSMAHLYLQLKEQDLAQQRARLPEQAQLGVQRQWARLDHAAVRLGLLDPVLVLQRGYAWVSTSESDERTVSRADDVALGQNLRIRLADGQLGATVTALQ
jgi:exodeoxyribonuclease VII large subunit